jgi:hypothetical protein
MAQEAHHQKKLDQVKSLASNPESRAAQEESTVAPGKRQGNKRSRRQAAAIPEKEGDNRNWYRRVELGTAIASGKKRTNLQDHQDDLEVGSAPTETKKGAWSRGGVGNVKALASPARGRARIRERKRMWKRKKNCDWWQLTGEPLRTSWL